MGTDTLMVLPKASQAHLLEASCRRMGSLSVFKWESRFAECSMDIHGVTWVSEEASSVAPYR